MTAVDAPLPTTLVGRVPPDVAMVPVTAMVALHASPGTVGTAWTTKTKLPSGTLDLGRPERHATAGRTGWSRADVEGDGGDGQGGARDGQCCGESPHPTPNVDPRYRTWHPPLLEAPSCTVCVCTSTAPTSVLGGAEDSLGRPRPR